VLGTAFTRTLRDAQAGDEAAFARLWSDANPLMVRYLRVIGVDDPYDAACEGWITVVRGLPGFTGDELAWRVWILACTRMRAEESSLRHGWASVTALPGVLVPGAVPGAPTVDDLEDLLDAEPADPAHRGLGDTIAALRALPLGQGEILMLRLGGGLTVQSVADVVGAEVATVQRSEARALERLGAEAELLAWSLAAPPTAAELADQRVATAAFRSIPRPPAWSVPRTRVVALGSALSSSSRSTRSGRGIANAAGRSRTALLGIALLSGSAMSLGGLGAAAYVGALPDPVQEVMHDTIGAPAPSPHGAGKATTGGRPSASRTGRAPSGSPTAAANPAVGLCRAWAADKSGGTPRQSSVAFRNLAAAAGGADSVDGYCVTVLATAPADPAAGPTARPTARPTAKAPTTTHPGGRPTTGGSPTTTLPTPATTSTTAGTTTGVPSPSTTTGTTTTMAPNPNSPTAKTSGPKTTKSSPPKTSPSKTSPPKTSPSQGGGAGGGKGGAKPAPTPTTTGSVAESPLPTPVTTG